jgi:hypothetical protein
MTISKPPIIDNDVLHDAVKASADSADFARALENLIKYGKSEFCVPAPHIVYLLAVFYWQEALNIALQNDNAWQIGNH